MIERDASLCLCFKERFFVLRDLNFDQICGKEQELAKIFQNTSKQNTKKYSKLLSLSLSLSLRARARPKVSPPSLLFFLCLDRAKKKKKKKKKQKRRNKALCSKAKKKG